MIHNIETVHHYWKPLLHVCVLHVVKVISADEIPTMLGIFAGEGGLELSKFSPV